MTFDVLTSEPLVRATYACGKTNWVTTAERIKHSRDIVALHVDDPTKLALMEHDSVYALSALEYTGAIRKVTSADDAEDVLDELYSLDEETLVAAVDAYAAHASRLGWYDLDHPHGLGQTDASAPPSPIDKGDFGSLDWHHKIELCTREQMTKRSVALAILTLRNRSIAGINKMPPVQGAVKYPEPGPLLRAPMAFVEGGTWFDTLIGSITSDLIADDSKPAWELGPPAPEGDKLGTRVTGPRAAMTVITRIPWLEFDSDDNLVSAAVSAGDCLSKDAVHAYTQTSKLILSDKGLKAPVSNYGNVHPPHLQSVFAVSHTLAGERNRSVEAAANYARYTGRRSVRVISITAVHSNLSKVSSLSSDAFAYPTDLFPPTSADPQTQRVITARNDHAAQCVVRAGKCAFLVHDAVLSLEKPIKDKRRRSTVADDVKAELLDDLGERFQEWVSRIPDVPADTSAVDTAMESHVDAWNEEARRVSTEYLDEYLATMPQQWWLSRDAAGRRARTIAGIRTSLGLPNFKEKK